MSTRCRCCLKEVENYDELHEFSSEVAIDKDQNFVKINDCFMDLTTLQIPEDEEDMIKICSSCLGDLKFCYLFKRKCIESFAKFLEQEHDDQNTGKGSFVKIRHAEMRAFRSPSLLALSPSLVTLSKRGF